jgi:hypothetical protein
MENNKFGYSCSLVALGFHGEMEMQQAEQQIVRKEYLLIHSRTYSFLPLVLP